MKEDGYVAKKFAGLEFREFLEKKRGRVESCIFLLHGRNVNVALLRVVGIRCKRRSSVSDIHFS